VWNAGASASFERIADEQILSARKSAMELALLARLAHAAPIDPATSAAIEWLARHPHGRMKQLSQWTGFSSRQLQRRFTAAVGYGPKMFQSVLRFQRVLNLPCRTKAPRNLAHISADAGYSDQAHMTREVQRFSGSPPTVLLRSALSALRLSPLLDPPADPDR
jgi:AraC-like DNA-binding protein